MAYLESVSNIDEEMRLDDYQVRESQMLQKRPDFEEQPGNLDKNFEWCRIHKQYKTLFIKANDPNTMGETLCLKCFVNKKNATYNTDQLLAIDDYCEGQIELW